MDIGLNKDFGQVVTGLIRGESLNAEEAYNAFWQVLNNDISEMQQGAFLAALTAKGETAEEVAGGWKAIYELDTTKVSLQGKGPVVDNCGTGMDTYKTFNISTAASLVAASGGITVARHGARGITSSCGTVDIVEALGVDVECDVAYVGEAIDKVGIGLFNGMSPKVHPMALGRILSQIYFGSPLNIAASLANPALPKMAVRGVYTKNLVMPVAKVMQSIGYTKATVVYGGIDGSDKGMDEASVCGTTYGARLIDGEICEFTFAPEECGLKTHLPDALAADPDVDQAALKMVELLHGKGDSARRDAVLLNSGLLFELTGKASSVEQGVSMARECMKDGQPIGVLTRWVTEQNRDPDQGLSKLNALIQKV